MVVRWRKLAGTEAAAAQTARNIVETLSGHIQRRFDAPIALAAGTASGDRLAQAVEPIGFIEAQERVAGFEWEESRGAGVRLVSDIGHAIEAETRKRNRARARLSTMDTSTSRPTRPTTVRVRPGRGGAQRRPVSDKLEQLAGLETYGDPLWWSVSGGATLGRIDLGNPGGNAVVFARLSGDEADDTLIGQLRPTFALVQRNQEVLRPRYVLLAVDMSGTREVRFDDDELDSGQHIRDDMVQIGRWIREGWLEHMVIRDQRRLARDTLYGEQIIRYFEKQRVDLWIAHLGRRVDYVTDRTTIASST